MKLTTITLGALAAVATLTGGANAQPNLAMSFSKCRRRIKKVCQDNRGYRKEHYAGSIKKCIRTERQKQGCADGMEYDQLQDYDEAVGAPIWPPIGGDNGWTGRDEMDDESVGAQIGWYGDEMDMFSRRLSRPGKAIPGLSLEQWEARKPNRQANRANRQARQAKRQVRKQTRQNRLDVWKARKPIRQVKRANRQVRKVIRQYIRQRSEQHRGRQSGPVV